MAVNPVDLIQWSVERAVWASMDMYNFTSIQKIAAIGDSYSAGIGAGNKLGNIGGFANPNSDWSCSRYDASYPSLINNSPHLGDPKKRNFQYVSCSGAKTKDVLENQIPRLDKGQDVILLSIGGNDADLTEILNQCVFQWAVAEKWQDVVAKINEKAEGEAAELLDNFDWSKMSIGCAGILKQSGDKIASSGFKASLDRVLGAAKAKLAPEGKIYYTGYAKFFAEDLSPECDKVSWATWVSKLWNNFTPDAKLDRGRRKEMNRLVDAMNTQLSAAAARAGPDVVYVHYDPIVGSRHGRMCEKGVDESSEDSSLRDGLMFYELRSRDLLGQAPLKRSNNMEMAGTFEGDINRLAEIVKLVDPDAKLAVPGGDNSKSLKDAIADKDAQIAEIQAQNLDSAAETTEAKAPAKRDFISSILPAGYGRVFHPTILLHELIAQAVLQEMSIVRSASLGWNQPQEHITNLQILEETQAHQKKKELDAKITCPTDLKTVDTGYLSAPRSHASGEAEGATGAKDAVNKFCKDNDQKTVSKGDGIYGRWGMTGYGYPERNSFWLRANLMTDGCTQKFDEKDCLKGFQNGMSDCDEDDPRTHGFEAALGCINYSLKLSGVTKNDSPPWNQKSEFPPPEYVTKNGKRYFPSCHTDQGMAPFRDIPDEEWDKAVDSMCQDGAEIKGFDRETKNAVEYPPKGQEWFQDQKMTMHSLMMAEKPADMYDDMQWCADWNGKIVRDDCRFALKKIRKSCTNLLGHFNGGKYKYRCVNYYVWHVNLAKE